MRCAVRRDDERLRLLVDALDVDGTPMAETWRLVGAAEAGNGRLRPSYALVRRLVLARRARERARQRMRQVALEAAVEFLAGRVPEVHRTIGRLYDAKLAAAAAERAEQPCVSETQGARAGSGSRRRPPPHGRPP